jgi:hypothetical protein
LGHGRRQPDFVSSSPIGTGGRRPDPDGQLRRGITGSAGEVGYLPLPGVPPTVSSGGPPATRGGGVYESAVAARGLVASARAAGLPARTAQQVVAAARGGNAIALAVVEREAVLLALGVATLTAVVDPGLVVLGGGVALGAADLLIPPLQAALRRLSPLRPRVVTSELGDHAVLDGAGATALAAAQDRVFAPVAGTRADRDAADRTQVSAARMTATWPGTPRTGTAAPRVRREPEEAS